MTKVDMNRRNRQTQQRQLSNDILIFEQNSMTIQDQHFFSEAQLVSRMFHSGFKIQHFMFSVGGQTVNGKILDEFVMIDLNKMKLEKPLVEKGKNLIK